MTTIPDSGLLTFDFGTLTATHTWDHSQTTYPGWTGTWLDSVDITLVGHSDGGSEPAKTMNWWWWNNQQAIKDAGITNADTYKVSSWAMVVDINFLATAPAFQSVVQHGSSQPAADQTGAIANGFGCQTTDISSGDFCLTEDANTNSLTGVCAQWGFQCNQASGCDPSHATTPVNCDDMTQDPPVSTAVASMADFCLALTAFTQPAVGDIGDEVGVAIWNAATKAIPGIRIGRRVDAITNCDQTTQTAGSSSGSAAVVVEDADGVDCTNQQNSNFGESWNFQEVTEIDYALLESVDWTGADPTTCGVDCLLAITSGVATVLSDTFFVDEAVCGAKWATAEGCHGIADPWAQNHASYPDGTTAAHHQYFRWLADAVKDRTAQFSVEKDDAIVVAIVEHGTQRPANNDGANQVQAYDHAAGATNYGFTGEREPGYICAAGQDAHSFAWFTVAGAYTMAAGATALAVATLF